MRKLGNRLLAMLDSEDPPITRQAAGCLELAQALQAGKMGLDEYRTISETLPALGRAFDDYFGGSGMAIAQAKHAGIGRFAMRTVLLGLRYERVP